MASALYFMEAAQLFCGDDDPTAGKALTLDGLKLPSMEETFQDWMPGGSAVGVEVSTGVQKLSAGFKLKGTDPAVLVQFGLGERRRQTYTAYGVIRDKASGVAIESKAILRARLGKAEGDEFKRGELQGYDYALNEIWHYELYIKGQEIYYFDFLTNIWRVGGVDQNADVNAILRI